MQYKILIVDDEQNLLNTIKLNLELEQFNVATASTGIEAKTVFANFNPHLILLDIMLPQINGFDLCTYFKQQQPNVGIIFLSAKNLTADKIEGLKLGADDYLTKPFELEELLLRIQNVLKRLQINNSNSSIFTFGNCEINFKTYTIKTNLNTTETLSKREIALLKLLIDNKNSVISRDEILDKLWSKDENPSSRTIDNYILNFRKLFEINSKEPLHFYSIRGVGYKFVSA